MRKKQEAIPNETTNEELEETDPRPKNSIRIKDYYLFKLDQFNWVVVKERISKKKDTQEEVTNLLSRKYFGTLGQAITYLADQLTELAMVDNLKQILENQILLIKEIHNEVSSYFPEENIENHKVLDENIKKLNRVHEVKPKVVTSKTKKEDIRKMMEPVKRGRRRKDVNQ